MDKFVALLAYVLSLFGCQTGTSTFEHHLRSDGEDTLRARATVDSGVARFECLASDSGACHYVVYTDARCAQADCSDRPAERFALAAGESRQRTGMQRFRLCVAATPEAQPADCAALGGAAVDMPRN